MTLDGTRKLRVKCPYYGVRIVGEMTGDKAVSIKKTGGSKRDRSLSVVVDGLYFLAILLFTAVAILAVALAAPLAIIATALAGAISAVTANGAKRSGWRVAGV